MQVCNSNGGEWKREITQHSGPIVKQQSGSSCKLLLSIPDGTNLHSCQILFSCTGNSSIVIKEANLELKQKNKVARKLRVY